MPSTPFNPYGAPSQPTGVTGIGPLAPQFTAPSVTPPPATVTSDLEAHLADIDKRISAADAVASQTDASGPTLAAIQATKDLPALIKERGDTAYNLSQARKVDPTLDKRTPEQKASDERDDAERAYNSVDHPGQPAVGNLTHAEAAQLRVAQQNANTALQNANTSASTAASSAATAATNATTAASTAATGASAQVETGRHNQVEEANAARLAQLQSDANAATVAQNAAQTVYQTKIADIDAKYKAGELSVDQMKAETDRAHLAASDAVAAATQATLKYQAEQTAQYQVGTLANSQAQTAETARSNQANEANNAATLLQRQQADKQASLDRQMSEGAGLFKEHAAQSSGMLNSWVNAAAGNKNFGLGGPIPQGMAAGMMGDANNFATQAMGGQSIMDRATQLVHGANPEIAATPAGAGYSSVAAQMIEKAAQPKMIAPQQTAQTGGVVTSGTPLPTAANPSDPTYLGSVIGAAVSHIGERNALNRFTAPSVGVTV